MFWTPDWESLPEGSSLAPGLYLLCSCHIPGTTKRKLSVYSHLCWISVSYSFVWMFPSQVSFHIYFCNLIFIWVILGLKSTSPMRLFHRGRYRFSLTPNISQNLASHSTDIFSPKTFEEWIKCLSWETPVSLLCLSACPWRPLVGVYKILVNWKYSIVQFHCSFYTFIWRLESRRGILNLISSSVHQDVRT